MTVGRVALASEHPATLVALTIVPFILRIAVGREGVTLGVWINFAAKAFEGSRRLRFDLGDGKSLAVVS